MKKIWKYRLSQFCKTLSIPCGAEVLHFAMQDGEPTIWVMVNPEKEKEDRTFSAFETGHWLFIGANASDYIGTCFDGEFILHLFELNK